MTENIPEIKQGQPGYLLQVINAMINGEVRTVKQEIELPEMEFDLEALLQEVEQNQSGEQA